MTLTTATGKMNTNREVREGLRLTEKRIQWIK